jgi:uncharacterized protein YndB with AHSA1/START domain
MKGAKMAKNDFKFEVDSELAEIIVTQVFDAPREKMWKAATDPKYIPQWWGPRNLITTIDKLDLKPGGAWRFVQRDPKGEEFAFRGVYKVVKPPQELSYTFEWEAMPGHILTESMVLEQEGEKTRSVSSIVFPSKEDMQGMLDTGMEMGNREGFERMVELLAKMK